MKLLIFTNFYPYGKMDRFIEAELPFLAKEFSEIIVFPLHKEQGKSFELKNLPICIEVPLLNYCIHSKLKLFVDGLFSFCNISYFIEELWQKKVFTKRNWFRNWLASTCTTRALLKPKTLKRILKVVDKDTILYFYWGDKTSGLVPFLKTKIGNSLIVRFHGSDLYEETKGGYQPYRKQLLTHLSLAITISAMGKKYLKDRYPNIHFKCEVFRLGTFKANSNLLSKPSEDDVFRMTSCSNLVSLKRLSLLMDALKLISFKVQWTIIGDGPLLNELTEMSKNLSANIEVNFKGQIPLKEIYDFYTHNAVDVFVNVSESEGIPVSIMEALSFGIPVIATAVGGTHEIVDEKVGFLVPKDISSGQLAESLTGFYELERSTKSAFRENAVRRWDELYNADRNYSDFARFIKTIIY